MQFIRSFKWLIPSIIFSIFLIVCRIQYTGTIIFMSLIWNLFLAIIPLYISYKVETVSNRKTQWLYAFVWLLFFPNSMYIVTDLFHLELRKEVPLWYDLLLIFSTALTGIIMGFLSLYKIEKWMRRFVKKSHLPFIIFFLLLLCGYGIYLGRYDRWNSWDIILRPISLAFDISHQVRHPFRNMNIWILSTAFAIWMYILYKYLPRIRNKI